MKLAILAAAWERAASLAKARKDGKWEPRPIRWKPRPPPVRQGLGALILAACLCLWPIAANAESGWLLVKPGPVNPAPHEFAGRWGDLRKVLTTLRACEYVAEPPGVDIWTLPDPGDCRGDCEDFAILAMDELVKLGWPRESFRMMLRPEMEGEQAHATACVWIEGREAVCVDPLWSYPIPLSQLWGEWLEVIAVLPTSSR